MEWVIDWPKNMRNLTARLTAAFLLVVLVALMTVALVMGSSVESSFRGYLGNESNHTASTEVAASLEVYYASTGSWEGVDALLEEYSGQRGPGSNGQGQRRGGTAGGITYTLFDVDGTVIATTSTDRGSQDATESELSSARLLTDSLGAPNGWLLVEAPSQIILNAAQDQYLTEVRRTLWLTALLAGGLALALGIGISQVIVRPLRKLTQAARSVASGEMGRQVEIGSGSAAEISTLASSFNQMSAALAEAADSRQRMTADIAHELRTPLSVMRSQLQAMLDGVYPTDAAHVATVYDQTLHLSRLVDDLHTLTRAETGHLLLVKRSVQPGDLVRRAAALFEPLAQDNGLTVEVHVEDDLPTLQADLDRLHQVMANLLANALRHTAAGGRIRLSARQAAPHRVLFSVANSGETLTPEQARHVFERFWRADDSRQRDGSGVGLGLAISQQLVHLHGGQMQVEIASGWTCFSFSIPVA
jgi:signal transduction histidine kinase